MKTNKAGIIAASIFSVFLFYFVNRITDCMVATVGQSGTIFDAIIILPQVLLNTISHVGAHPLYISLSSTALVSGLIAATVPWLVWLYGLGERKNFKYGEEYGSARWAALAELEKLKDKTQSSNMVLSADIAMTMNTRQTGCNNNIMVVGGAGTGKTRYFVKPNLLQFHSSYVVTDPKGEIRADTATAFIEKEYVVKSFNLLDPSDSDKYNPFAYIRPDNAELDMLKLIDNIISNTEGKAPSGDSFWTKSEKLYMSALFNYVFTVCSPEERNMATIMELQRLAEVSDKEGYQSPLDILFEELRQEQPQHFAVKQYDIFKQGAGDTLKSILISAGVRLQVFNIPLIAELTRTDTIELDTLGDKKTVLYIITSPTDKSLNFLAGIMYQQLFDCLFWRANNVYKDKGRRLPVPVRCLMDEFANIAQIPDFEQVISVIRSADISVCPILQNMAQLKALYKDTWGTIEGNCSTLIYLGGKEKDMHKYIAELIGKSTVDLRNNSISKGKSGSMSVSSQVLGRDLITAEEVGSLKSNECIVSIQGQRPFKGNKYDLLKHPNYSLLADADPNRSYVAMSLEDRQAAAFLNNVKNISEII